MMRPTYAAMAQHASFEHEKLKLSDRSIRLFQVQRGGTDEPISLRMTQFSASRRPPYKAVSYTWGSAAHPKQILVNGKAFLLHVNLWNLLYHLRLEKETSFLWADALCINQFNLRERNFHVQLMGRIYERAESVIVWLGIPSSDRTEIRAMDFIKEVATYRKSHTDREFIQTFLRPDLQHRWETLLRMCNPIAPEAYWNRTWVIQEFLFAQAIEAFAGKHKLDWKQFEDLLEVCRREPVLADNSIVSKILLSRTARLTLRRKAGSQSNLLELLQEYSDSSCTERRDKIYGILGLAADCAEDPETGEARGVRPDYEKHIIGVYLEALECIHETLPSTDVLPAAATLVLQSLHVDHKDVVDYVNKILTSAPNSSPARSCMIITPDYVAPIVKTWPWTSLRDLQQKLESEDWGEYIGYEVQRVPSNAALAPTRGRARRLSSRTTHSALPNDFIPNVLEAANLCTDLATLHNYPAGYDLEIPLEHIVLHSYDKATFENGELQKPLVILDHRDDGEKLRLGFACVNATRGDLIVQFKGLDTTLIVRPVWHEYKLVGKAMMVRNANLVYESPVDPICDFNTWSSHCWYKNNQEGLQLKTDALSLAELLLKS